MGHVRYGTTGRNNRKNCQPIEVNHQKGKMALAHNGNLSNALELRDKLELSGAIFHTTSDTETIAYMITRERLTAPSIEEAVSRAMTSLEGAYSLILMSSAKMIAVRDPYGFRPFVTGKCGRLLCDCLGKLRPDICRRGTDQGSSSGRDPGI